MCVGWGCRWSQDPSPQGAPSPVPTAPGLALPPRSLSRHTAPSEAAASGAFVKLLFIATVTPASVFYSLPRPGATGAGAALSPLVLLRAAGMGAGRRGPHHARGGCRGAGSCLSDSCERLSRWQISLQ